MEEAKDKKKGAKSKTFIDRYVPKGAVKPLVWVVAYGVVSGTVANLLHLPKDDRSIPLTLAPGLKVASGTASSTSAMTVITRKL